MSDTDRPDTRRAIMDATYRALCEHGYAGLTMQDIADELGKSTSLLHYHFDTKDELLVAFIDHLLADLEGRMDADDDPPEERLAALFDLFVFGPDDDRAAFHIALLELRSQAPFNDAYRERFRRSDELLRGAIVDVIEDGIDAGVFRASADPEAVAQLIFAALDGARVRQVTLTEAGYAASVRDALCEHVIDDLLVEESEGTGA